MGNSTISLQSVNDFAAAAGIPVPTQGASGYNTDLALRIGSNVMMALIAERFNWKWNRVTAAPFYTNTYQQDYPQIGISNCGWLEDCDRVDINNTSMPKPLWQLTCRRQLSRTSRALTQIAQICWMYNSELSYGTWPGAGQVYSPLVVTPPAIVQQNPIMSMIDKNGNLLIVTGFGTTGLTAPFAPAASLEGVTVTDGTVTWTVVDPNGQGFRVDPLPNTTGPVYQVSPIYQKRAVPFTTLGQLLDPIPDDYSMYFQAGYEAHCLLASPNPADKARAQGKGGLLEKWFASMVEARGQGDREADSYAMLPASSPVETVYGGLRNPQDPSQPY